MYGPGLTMTCSPSLWAVKMYFLKSKMPVKSNCPGKGSCMFHATYLYWNGISEIANAEMSMIVNIKLLLFICRYSHYPSPSISLSLYPPPQSHCNYGNLPFLAESTKVYCSKSSHYIMVRRGKLNSRFIVK